MERSDLPDPWQPWLDELAAAVAANEEPRIEAELEELWRFEFHDQRAARPASWDRLFTLLAGLLTHEESSIRDRALHYVWVVMGAQLGPPWEAHGAPERQASIRRRTAELLPALAAAVDAGKLSLLRIVDDLAHVEDLGDLAPQPEVEALFDERVIAPALARAARLAYRAERSGGPTPEELTRDLDSEEQIVRAYAARGLGRLYAAADPEPEPPLAARVDGITVRELARPGIAGPFVDAWYDHGLAEFERRSGRRVEEWFLTILSERAGPEPETLPCSNGIDFFAHERLAGRADLIERLVVQGEVRLAAEAATEIDEAIDELRPVLRRLAGDRDDDVARRAAWHLASVYREHSPEGAARGFVAHRVLPSGAELFATLPPAVGLAAIFPLDGATFDDAGADDAESELLPPSLRGELETFGMPGDGGAPGPWRFGRTESRRFRSGALLERRGDLETRRWDRLRIVWRGVPHAFRPLR